jgi:trans-2,3-dihydro-3-hydroxyanthranilate isomerase
MPHTPSKGSSFKLLSDASKPPSARPGQSPKAMQSRQYRYRMVDVFAEEPFTGNPLAVFTNASGLDDQVMRRIARELNRSQTSFVFPARPEDSGPRVRVYSPHAELGYLRHPTIGTAFALEYETQIAQGVQSGRVVLQGSDGPISVSMFACVMTVKQPVPRLGAVYEDVEAIIAMLGLKPADRMFQAPVQFASADAPFLVVPLGTRAALKGIRFRTDIWERILRRAEPPKILAFTRETDRSGSSAKMRVFAPDVGVFEEAATESAGGPLAAYLIHYGMVSSQPNQVLVVEQGDEVDRPSFLHVAIEREGDELRDVRVGGQCVSVGEGMITVAVPASDREFGPRKE